MMNSNRQLNSHFKLSATLILGLSSLKAFCFGQTVQPLPNTIACRAFEDFATQRVVDKRYITGDHKPLEPFATDAIVVIKDGIKEFEWYDGLFTQQTPHSLWSASKVVTATLLARVIQEGYTYNGLPVTLKTKLADFFPNPGPVVLASTKMYQQYRQITLEQLVEMSANFDWKEYYDDDMSNSSFLPMLYGKGSTNMSQFALNQPLNPEGPGGKWVYSGGNANILMAVLEKIVGKEAYPTMPDKLLFEPLGITKFRIEKDASGHFIGSSYVYLALEEYAKLGDLYLNGGAIDGKQLLPLGWTQAAQEMTPAIYAKATTLDVIKALGAQSKRLFWLNQDIVRDDGLLTRATDNARVLYPQEMPEAPSDLFFAAGHYGQILAIVPSHHLVIARFGHDMKYWDHVQPLVVKALSCLEPDYKPNPVKDLTPPSGGSKRKEISEAWHNYKTIHYFKDSGVGLAILAKEMCSFMFVSGFSTSLNPKKFESEYLSRSGLPSIATDILTNRVDIKVDTQQQLVSVAPYTLVQNTTPPKSMGVHRVYGKAYVARLGDDPVAGCRLTETH